MTDKSVSVYVLTKDKGCREYFCNIISSHSSLRVVGTGLSCMQARQFISYHDFDIALIDLNMPDGCGTSIINLIAEQCPGKNSLVITSAENKDAILAAIEAGASGCVPKNSSFPEITNIILKVASNTSTRASLIAKLLLTLNSNQLIDKEIEKGHTLTRREVEILRFIAKGLSYHAISAQLSLSYHTVATHIKNIYSKLSVSSRGEAVFQGMQLGLIDMDSTAEVKRL